MLISECYVGAKVRAIYNTPYCITTDGWEGKITEIRANGYIKVEGPDLSGRLDSWPVQPQYFNLISEPKSAEPKPEPKSYALTDEERNYLLSNMKSLLSEYDYRYTESALTKIIDPWATNKADLISAFKRHPNYLEGKFMIAFSKDFERTGNKNNCVNFAAWLKNNSSEIKDFLPDEVKARKEDERTIFPWNIWDFIEDDLPDITDQFISEEVSKVLNVILPEIHAHAGQKTSRIINKFCCYLGYDKLPAYNREFAKYADALNPLTIKRHTVLSISPLDYLTMSFGNSWASCHTIDKTNKRNMPNDYSGCYSSGTISYMLDGTSMVFYTIDASYNGDEFWNEPKIDRQMFHWGEEKLIQGRLYPQDNDGNYDAYKPYRNVVQEIISIIYDIPNLWDVTKGTGASSKYIISDGTNYKDYVYYDNCNLSRLRGSTNENHITVGHMPICIECGYEHNEERCINCCHMPGHVCADCGSVIEDEEDEVWIDGECYCHECVSYCDSCGEYHRGGSTWINSENRYVCDSCLDEYYTSCEECGEYVASEDTVYIDGEEIYVCRCCADNYFTPCEDCGQWFRNTNILSYNEGEANLCHDCYNERMESEAV